MLFQDLENYFDITISSSGYNSYNLLSKYLYGISGFADLYFKYPYHTDIYNTKNYLIKSTSGSLEYLSNFDKCSFQ